jgi:hypothetical protein
MLQRVKAAIVAVGRQTPCPIRMGTDIKVLIVVNNGHVECSMSRASTDAQAI